jgi:hypothetical protein
VYTFLNSRLYQTSACVEGHIMGFVKKSLSVFNAFQVIRELSMRPGCHSQNGEINNFFECRSAFIFVM